MHKPRSNQCHSLLHPWADCISNQPTDSFPPTYQNKKETAITPGLMKYAFTLLRSDCSTVYAIGSSNLFVFPPTDLSDLFIIFCFASLGLF